MAIATPLSFRLWQSPNDASFERIYLGNLPTGIKAYIFRRGRSSQLKVEGSGDLEAAEDAILDAIEAQGLAPNGQLDYAAIKAVAAGAGPRKAPRAAKPTPRGMARDTQLSARSGSHDLDVTSIPIPESGIDIQVDHREPQAIVDLLRMCPNVRVEVVALPVGDFVVGPLIIERKVVNDFEQSVMSGRMFDEANRIGLEKDAIGVVILEGDLFGEGQSLLIQGAMGAITCLSQVQHMSVIHSLDHVMTAYFIIKASQHLLFGLGYELPLHRTKPKELLDAKRYLLQALPGVSGKNAVTLLEHFGSVGAVMRASKSELLAVNGIGPKTADRILDVLG